MKTRLLAMPSAFFLLAALVSTSPAAAAVIPSPSTESTPPIEVPALPTTLTNEQMAELTDESATPKIAFDETPEETQERLETLDLELTASEPTSVKTASFRAGAVATADFHVQGVRGGAKCYLVPGNMWFRKSSGYGGVGSKPSLRNCSSDVVKTGMASEVFRQEWWGWTKVAGPFNSWGTGNMQSNQVTYYCNGQTRENRFQVITTAWGTTGRGQTGVGRDSTGSYAFRCN